MYIHWRKLMPLPAPMGGGGGNLPPVDRTLAGEMVLSCWLNLLCHPAAAFDELELAHNCNRPVSPAECACYKIALSQHNHFKSHRAETQTECDTKKLDNHIAMLPGVQGPQQKQVQGTNAHFL